MSTETMTGVAQTNTSALMTRMRTADRTFSSKRAISVLKTTVRATQANVNSSERTITWWNSGSARIAR